MDIMLKIFDHSFKLACDPSEEKKLRQAATELEKQLYQYKAQSPKLDNESIAILVALELCRKQLDFSENIENFSLCQQLLQQINTDLETLMKKKPTETTV